MKSRRAAASVLFVLAAYFSIPDPALACSRILWNTNGSTIVAARSMDWSHSFDDWMFVYPRDREMTGGELEHPAEWTSRYGSVATSIIGYAERYGYDWVKDGATDGINEAGLAVHVLYLHETTYPEPDERPGVSYLRWARYMLDNFATVAEAVEGMQNIRIEAVEVSGTVLGAHMAIEDPTGDSAVFEIIDGEMQIHHGKEHTVMTNDPAYPLHIENLKGYTSFGGKAEMPGTTASEDRFVRASYYLKYLPEPEDGAEAAASIHSLILNTAVPFGAPYGDGVYPTWWTSIADLTDMIYYFNWVKNPNIIWVTLENIDFSAGNPVLQINPRNPDLVGDISGAFEPVSH